MVILDYINTKTRNAHYYFNKAFLEVNNIKNSDTIALHQEYFEHGDKESLKLKNNPKIKIFTKSKGKARIRSLLNIIELIKTNDKEYLFLAYDLLNLLVFIIIFSVYLRKPKLKVIVHNNAKDLNSKIRRGIYKTFFRKVEFLTLDKSTHDFFQSQLNAQVRNIGFYYSIPENLKRLKENNMPVKDNYICLPSRRNVDEYFLELLINNSRFKNYLRSNKIKFLSFYPISEVDNKLIEVVPKGLTEEEYYLILKESKFNIYLFNKNYSNRNSVSIIESYLLGTPYCILTNQNQFEFIEQKDIFFSSMDSLIKILEKREKITTIKPYKELNRIILK